MLVNIALGCALMVVTTILHALAMHFGIRWVQSSRVQRWADGRGVTKIMVIVIAVMIMFLAVVIEASIWASAYVALGALPEFDEAMYFSTVTYTTLGYGDITLSGRWRLLSAFQAANGIIIFGLTTALIVSTVQRVYQNSGIRHA